MNRLSALDASFIYSETSETPMNVGSLAIFAPPPIRTMSSPVFATIPRHGSTFFRCTADDCRKLRSASIIPRGWMTTISISTITSAVLRCRSPAR